MRKVTTKIFSDLNELRYVCEEQFIIHFHESLICERLYIFHLRLDNSSSFNIFIKKALRVIRKDLLAKV